MQKEFATNNQTLIGAKIMTYTTKGNSGAVFHALEINNAMNKQTGVSHLRFHTAWTPYHAADVNGSTIETDWQKEFCQNTVNPLGRAVTYKEVEEGLKNAGVPGWLVPKVDKQVKGPKLRTFYRALQTLERAVGAANLLDSYAPELFGTARDADMPVYLVAGMLLLTDLGGTGGHGGVGRWQFNLPMGVRPIDHWSCTSGRYCFWSDCGSGNLKSMGDGQSWTIAAKIALSALMRLAAMKEVQDEDIHRTIYEVMCDPHEVLKTQVFRAELHFSREFGGLVRIKLNGPDEVPEMWKAAHALSTYKTNDPFVFAAMLLDSQWEARKEINWEEIKKETAAQLVVAYNAERFDAGWRYMDMPREKARWVDEETGKDVIEIETTRELMPLTEGQSMECDWKWETKDFETEMGTDEQFQRSVTRLATLMTMWRRMEEIGEEALAHHFARCTAPQWEDHAWAEIPEGAFCAELI